MDGVDKNIFVIYIMGTKKRIIRGGKMFSKKKGFIGVKMNIDKDKYQEEAMDNVEEAVNNLIFLIKKYYDNPNNGKLRIVAFCNAMHIKFTKAEISGEIHKSDKKYVIDNKKIILDSGIKDDVLAFFNNIFIEELSNLGSDKNKNVNIQVDTHSSSKGNSSGEYAPKANEPRVITPNISQALPSPPEIKLFGKNIVVPSYKSAFQDQTTKIITDLDTVISEIQIGVDKENKRFALEQTKHYNNLKPFENKFTGATDHKKNIEQNLRDKLSDFDKATKFLEEQRTILKNIDNNQNLNIAQAIAKNDKQTTYQAIFYCVNLHPEKTKDKTYVYVPANTLLKDICDDIKVLNFLDITEPKPIQDNYVRTNFDEKEFFKNMFFDTNIERKDKLILQYNELLGKLKDKINKVLSMGHKLGGGAFGFPQAFRSVSDETKDVLTTLYKSYKDEVENLKTYDVNKITRAITALNLVNKVFKEVYIKDDNNGTSMLMAGETIFDNEATIINNKTRINNDTILSLSFDNQVNIIHVGGGSRKRKNQKKSKTLRRK